DHLPARRARVRDDHRAGRELLELVLFDEEFTGTLHGPGERFAVAGRLRRRYPPGGARADAGANRLALAGAPRITGLDAARDARLRRQQQAAAVAVPGTAGQALAFRPRGGGRVRRPYRRELAQLGFQDPGPLE